MSAAWSIHAVRFGSRGVPHNTTMRAGGRDGSFFSVYSISLAVSSFFTFLPFSRGVRPRVFSPSRVIRVVYQS